MVSDSIINLVFWRYFRLYIENYVVVIKLLQKKLLTSLGYCGIIIIAKKKRPDVDRASGR